MILGWEKQICDGFFSLFIIFWYFHFRWFGRTVVGAGNPTTTSTTGSQQQQQQQQQQHQGQQQTEQATSSVTSLPLRPLLMPEKTYFQNFAVYEKYVVMTWILILYRWLSNLMQRHFMLSNLCQTNKDLLVSFQFYVWLFVVVLVVKITFFLLANI